MLCIKREFYRHTVLEHSADENELKKKTFQVLDQKRENFTRYILSFNGSINGIHCENKWMHDCKPFLSTRIHSSKILADCVDSTINNVQNYTLRGLYPATLAHILVVVLARCVNTLLPLRSWFELRASSWLIRKWHIVCKSVRTSKAKGKPKSVSRELGWWNEFQEIKCIKLNEQN